MRSIADLTVVAPADAAQLKAVIKASVDYPRPIYIRIQRGRDPTVYDESAPFSFGRAIAHRCGRDLTITACGSTVHPSLVAAEAMVAKGYSVGVIDMATIKPLDREAVLGAAASTKAILTVEEHNTLGGLGSAVAEVIAEEGVPVRVHRHGIYDEYSLIAPPTHLYAHYRLDASGIESVAMTVLA